MDDHMYDRLCDGIARNEDVAMFEKRGGARRG